MWPQVLTWVQAGYDKVLAPGSLKYEQVEIFFENESIVRVSVDEVS